MDEATVAESGETAERLHRMLSAALEAGYADRARVMLGRSGDDLPLTRVLAGRVALVGGDAATALAEADAVLARGDDLPRPPCEGIAGTADIDTRLAALDIRARALDFLGDRVAAGQAWAAQAKQAVAAGRTQAELRAVFHLGKQEFFDGHGLDRLREAVELARRAGALIELAWAEETLAIALILQGDPAAALEVLDAAIPRPKSSASCWPRGRAACLHIFLAERSWHTTWSCLRRSSGTRWPDIPCGREARGDPGGDRWPPVRMTTIPNRPETANRRRNTGMPGKTSAACRILSPRKYAVARNSHAAIVFQDFIRYALSAVDNIALGRHERAVDFAALDAKAEHELFARIGELFADRSVLLISHRFPTVRSADRIYVLNEGYVVESGTHEELLAAGGTYAELFTLQAPRTSSASPVRARLA